MKKVLLVLALVVAYGVSISNASTKVVSVEKSNVTVVADSDDFSPAMEEEKDKKKKKTTKACCGDKATTAKKCTGEKPSAGCSEAQKKSCAASGKTCGDAKAKTATKACCGDKKK